MQNDIRWFVRLGVDQHAFSQDHALAVLAALGPEPTLLDFAQKLIDERFARDVDHLERLAEVAHSKGNLGPPIDDPFAATAAARAAAGSASSAVAPTAPPAPPAFPFDQMAALSDAELADAFRRLLKATAAHGASDLHLCAGAAPFIRQQRELRTLSPHVLTADESLRLNTALLSPEQHAVFLDRKDLDYALALDPANRYRVNLMVHKAGPAGAYRMVPAQIPRLDSLGLRDPAVVRRLLDHHNGLVLVTGPVGAGKTTTLAALVAELNANRHDHVITVEDPIEIVQPGVGCNITQREVGTHTRSFASALKGALREDPDVIVIGELRDLETIEMAISASETGHLVIGTMHTSDATTTLNRLLDAFPAAQQAQIRASVAESLRGIVCQRLLPGIDGRLVLACEILIGNAAVSSLIRDGKTQGLRNVMETGAKQGMRLMEHDIFELWQTRRITADTARRHLTNRVLLSRLTPDPV